MATQHPTRPNCFLYESCAVHKSSDLGQALAENSPKARELFAEQKAAFIKQYGQEFWDRPNIPPRPLNIWLFNGP